MGIKHKQLFGGDLHLLMHTNNGKPTMQVGIVEVPGEVQLEPVRGLPQSITVVWGEIVINGTPVCAGESVAIRQGPIELRVIGPAIYFHQLE